MAKKRNPSDTSRIVVLQPESFTNEARAKFEIGLGRKKLGFKNERLTDNQQAASLSGEGAVSLPDRTLVIPLSSISNRLFFFGATLTFEAYSARYALKSISMRVYEGLARDSKELVLRAEWDRPEVSGKFKHAQPHWHAYPLLSAAFPSQEVLPSESETITVNTSLLSDTEIADYTSGSSDILAPNERITKFHLAMAMRWHESNEDCQIGLSDKNQVLGWIQYCTSYIVQQLTYLS